MVPHLLPLLLATLLPSPSSCLAIGWGAGVTSQIRQTLAAAAAANTQWFPYTGTDCAAAAATAALQPGWPGAQVSGVSTPAPGALSICLRRRVLLRGGRWSPWRQVAGTVGAAWRPDWGSIGGVRDPEFDISAVIDDAVLAAEDAVLAAEDAAADLRRG